MIRKIPTIPAGAGIDDGYRQVKIREDKTPMVVVDSIDSDLVYHRGHIQGISLYSKGIGAPNVPLLRKPMNAALGRAAKFLQDCGMQLILLDGFRSVAVQAKLFRTVFAVIAGVQRPSDLTNMDSHVLLKLGMQTDAIASYATLVVNEQFSKHAEALRGYCDEDQLKRECGKLGLSMEEGLQALVTIMGNLQPHKDLPLDTTATTTHGLGGAADVWVRETSGKPVMLGVPYDYTKEVAAFPAMEEKSGWDAYKRLAETDPILQQYLLKNGVQHVNNDLCATIRDNRQTLYEALRQAGLSMYENECWHCDGDGSPSHAVVRARETNPSVDPATLTARWGNQYAHEQATQLGYC